MAEAEAEAEAEGWRRSGAKLAMLLPLLFLELLWLLPPSSSTSITPKVLQWDACLDAGLCNDMIPYPFGNADISPASYREGFRLEWDFRLRGQLMLPLGSKRFQVLEISLLEGYVRIQLPTLTWRCGARGSSGGESPSEGDTMINLEGTPYVFSDVRNKFTVTGCDALAFLNGSGSINHIGCAAFCVSKDSIIDGSCSGVGCCQASIPRGLKKMGVDLRSIWNLTRSRFDNSSSRMTSGEYKNLTAQGSGYALCSKAFLAENFVFSANDLSNTYTYPTWPVVLDWWIGNETCAEAKKTSSSSSFACLADKSSCYDSPTVRGYRCNCTQGYSGNPYVQDGCQDVDECRSDPETNPCVHKCVNTPGGYRCSCRLGMTGDGLKEGTGCKRVAPLELALGLVLFTLILTVAGGLWSYGGWKKRKANQIKQHFFMRNGGHIFQQRISSRKTIGRIFTSEELKKATAGFHDSRIVGRGGYGTVYKGILSDQRVVAIKKSKLVDETQMEQFINEVVILSQIKHPNVVKLLGCCLETEVPLLVYEFISNGTLFHHVHERVPSSPPMSWEDRLRIAVETAAALANMHSVAAVPIIHRDFKSANILLDENFTAKVSDFGASRLLPCNRTHVTTLVQGTLGYLDPEYFHTGQLTEKSDVYSFGVVLVELLTREKPLSFFRAAEEINLASHFVLLEKEERLLEVIDGQTIDEAGIRHISAVAQLAGRCLSVKGEERPTMREVAVELDALRRLMKQSFVQEGRLHGVIQMPEPPQPIQDSMENCLLEH